MVQKVTVNPSYLWYFCGDSSEMFFFWERAIIIIYLFMAAEASVAAAYGWLMKDKLIDEKHFRASVLRIDWKR